MAPLRLLVGAVRISHLSQVAQDAAESGWVHAPGRRKRHRLGLGGDVVGQAVGEHRGVGGRDLPVAQGFGGSGKRAAEQGPGGPHAVAGRAGAQVKAVAQPAGGGGAWVPWSAPAAPQASTPASSPSQWPSRRSTSRRRISTRSTRTASGSWRGPGGQAIHGRREGRQVVRRPSRGIGRTPVRVHGGTLSAHTRTQAPTQMCWITPATDPTTETVRTGPGQVVPPPTTGAPGVCFPRPTEAAPPLRESSDSSGCPSAARPESRCRCRSSRRPRRGRYGGRSGPGPRSGRRRRCCAARRCRRGARPG
jgi:hypothetical protein